MYIQNELYAACCASTPVDILRKLGESPCAAIRARVAENSATPADLLEILSRDQNSDVRAAVASNPQTPLTLVWELASDASLDVRYAIAGNPLVVLDVLIWLVGDDNPYVSTRAEKTVEAVVTDQCVVNGGKDMATKNMERTVRQMLRKHERLNRNDAVQLKELVLSDGYISRSERKIMIHAIENNLLDDDALEVVIDLLLQRSRNAGSHRAIA
jgi:hypothetical protein